MKPVIGNAPEIIQQAISLGLLCRPVYHGRGCRIGVGEALEPTMDSFFWCIPGDHEAHLYTVSPAELLLDWELTTRDLLAAEYRKACEEPW